MSPRATQTLLLALAAVILPRCPAPPTPNPPANAHRAEARGLASEPAVVPPPGRTALEEAATWLSLSELRAYLIELVSRRDELVQKKEWAYRTVDAGVGDLAEERRRAAFLNDEDAWLTEFASSLATRVERIRGPSAWREGEGGQARQAFVDETKERLATCISRAEAQCFYEFTYRAVAALAKTVRADTSRFGLPPIVIVVADDRLTGIADADLTGYSKDTGLKDRYPILQAAQRGEVAVDVMLPDKSGSIRFACAAPILDAGRFWGAVVVGVEVHLRGAVAFDYPPDLAWAREHLAKAMPGLSQQCDLGSDLACFIAGFCYEEGIGPPKDIGKARDAYRRACELTSQSRDSAWLLPGKYACTRAECVGGTRADDGQACLLLAWASFARESPSLRSRAKAIELLKDGCRLGSHASCAAFEGSDPSGENVIMDTATAIAHLTKACAQMHVKAAPRPESLCADVGFLPCAGAPDKPDCARCCSAAGAGGYDLSSNGGVPSCACTR